MSIRLLHLSDIHFGCENAEALEAVRDFAAATPVAAIAVTGDVTQFGWREEFQSAAAWLKALPGQVICTPGNHDTPYLGVFDRLFWPFARYASAIGPADGGNWTTSDLNIQTINTARGAQVRLNWSKGAVRARDAERATAATAAGDLGALRVVICHHPLMEITNGPMTGRVRGGRRASEILAAGEVDLILTGHVHMPFAHPLPFGDRRTYAVGAGTLSLRERGSPPGFNVIEVDEKSIRITALGWTGRGLEPERSWGFERRARG